MKKKLSVLIAAAAALSLSAVALTGCGGSQEPAEPTEPAAPAADSLRFVTGGESGTYYAFGGVIAQHATTEAGVPVTALTSGGSQDNINQLQDGQADLAFCQSDVMSYALSGTNIFEETGAVDCFSVVAAMYDEQVQIVTCNPEIKTVADLAGKNVSIGAPGSGVYFNAIDILGAYGLTESDINPTYQAFGDSANSLKDGQIDAAFIVAGAPTTAVVDLSSSKQVYLVSLDQEHVDKLVAESDFYAAATIAADSKAGTEYKLTEDVLTVAVPCVILANDTVSEDQIYALCADIFDNAANLTDNHAKYAELSLEKATSMTAAYHAGAAKYFAEQGIEVPTK